MERIRPTLSEWEILNTLWDAGPLTVREVHERLAETRAVQYTTTLKLMQIMTDKGLVRRDETERAHRYEAAVDRKAMQQGAAEEILDRVFGGSAAVLMQRALSRRQVRKWELEEMRRIIDAWEEES